MACQSLKVFSAAAVAVLAAGCASNAPAPAAPAAVAAEAPAAAPEPVVANDPSLGAPFATKYARFDPVQFASLPGWATDSQRESLAAFKQSCQALKKKAVWSELCAKVAAFDGRDDQRSRMFFEENFHAYSVLAPNQAADGVITGYYEPLLKGSRTRGGRYLYPVYGAPADLLYISAKAVTGASRQWFTLADRKLTPAEPGAPGAREYTMKLNDVDPNVRDKRFRVCIQGDTIAPYYSRQELEGRDIKAQVFAWVDDPYALYSMQVQGSGKIRLGDGEIVRVAYAEQNGYPFLPHGSTDDVAAASVAVKTRGLKIGNSAGPGAAAPSPVSAAPAAPPAKPQNQDVANIIASLKGNAPAPAAAPPPPPPPKPAAVATSAPAASASSSSSQSGDVAALIAALKKPGSGSAAASARPAAPAGGSSAASTIEFAETTAGTHTDIPDPSYVFFRRIPDGPQGPTGALGVPLTAGRSIAVDPRTTPLGYPVFLSVNAPDGGKAAAVNRLMFAQDTGGAIRGPVRADFFWGFGQDAGAKASSMNNPGRMWLLIPRGVEVAALNPATRTRGPGGLSNAECVIPDDENCVEE